MRRDGAQHLYMHFHGSRGSVSSLPESRHETDYRNFGGECFVRGRMDREVLYILVTDTLGDPRCDEIGRTCFQPSCSIVIGLSRVN